VYFTLAYRCECSQAKAVPKGKARAGILGFYPLQQICRERILLSLTAASVLKRKRSRRGKLGREFLELLDYSKF